MPDRGIGVVSRRAALLAWSLATLSLTLQFGGILLSRAAGLGASELPSGRVGEPFSVAITLAMMLIFSVVGAIVVSRHPRNTIGWLFCSTGLVASLNSFTGGYAELWLASGYGTKTLAETAAWFSSWLWIPLVLVPPSLLLLLFPDGRPPSPRWRPVAWCAVLGIVGFAAGYALQPGRMEDFPEIVNPYVVDSPVLEVVGLVSVIAVGGSMVASAVSLLVRLRRAGGRERQQLKWLAYGGAVVVGTIFVSGVIGTWRPFLSIAIIAIALLVLPILTGVAIVKHRLYDIDVVINRTLVYGPLTVMLALLYFGGVVGLQRLLSPLVGEDNGLATVASTLAIAALFNPLRRRVQALVDRRFYRGKYDARKTLETFSTRLRNETDLDALNTDLLEVVRDTMQPAHVSLWLRPEMAPGERADWRP